MGCKYGRANYDTVGACFLEQAPALLASTPSGDQGLEADLRAAEESIEVLEGHRQKLVALMIETGVGSLATEINTAEAELETLKASRDALAAKVEASAGPVLDGRLTDLRAALGDEVLDRAKVNALLRSVLSKVVIDPDAKVGRLVWKHGGESELVFGVPKAP